MMKSILKFIHDLRIFFFAVIVISFLYNIGVNPVALGKFIGAKIGLAVGISTSTSVPSNPFNSVAMQLAEKEKRLADKESQLSRREAGLDQNGSSQKYLIYFLSIGIIVLFGLIILNYYLDFRRRRQKNK